MNTWVIALNAPWMRMPECVAARYRSIERDPRFHPIQTELLSRGFVPVGGIDSHNWLNNSLRLDLTNETLLQNMHIFNGLALEMTCDYFNKATYHPLRQLFPKVRVSNYQAFTWDQKHW